MACRRAREQGTDDQGERRQGETSEPCADRRFPVDVMNPSIGHGAGHNTRYGSLRLWRTRWLRRCRRSPRGIAVAGRIRDRGRSAAPAAPWATVFAAASRRAYMDNGAQNHWLGCDSARPDRGICRATSSRWHAAFSASRSADVQRVLRGPPRHSRPRDGRCIFEVAASSAPGSRPVAGFQGPSDFRPPANRATRC